MKKFSLLLLLLCSMLFVQAENSALYQSGITPVAYWSFSSIDASAPFTSEIGDVLAQYTGASNVQAKVSSQFGTCPFIEYNASPILTTSDPLANATTGTISLWVKSSRVNGSNQGFISKSTNYVCVNHGTSHGFDIRLPGVTFTTVEGQTAPADFVFVVTQWYHVVLTWDTQSSAIYIDGVKVATGGAPSAFGTDNWYLGSDRGISGRGAGGNIDEVLMFSQALTDAQISTLYTEGAAGSEFYTPPFSYGGDLRPVTLSNPRGADACYLNAYDARIQFIINDPFDADGFDPNGTVDMSVVGPTYNYHFTTFTTSNLLNTDVTKTVVTPTVVPADYYANVNFESPDFASEAKDDYNWASVDFTVPRGMMVERLFYWSRQQQYGWQYNMGVMLEETATATRQCSANDASASAKSFKMTDDAYYCMITFADVADYTITSGKIKQVKMDKILRCKADRVFVLRAEGIDPDVEGIHVNELRLAVGPASAWEIDSLSAPVVGKDTVIASGADFDLAALQAEYASMLQFRDVWGYDTTGVVTWNVTSLSMGTTTITGTVALPTGTVDDDNSVTLTNITFDVTLATATELANQIDVSVNIFPNPTDALFTIKGLTETCSMTVFNLAGAQVMSQMVGTSEASVDVSSLKSGLYVVNVAGQNMKLQVK